MGDIDSCPTKNHHKQAVVSSLNICLASFPRLEWASVTVGHKYLWLNSLSVLATSVLTCHGIFE